MSTKLSVFSKVNFVVSSAVKGPGGVLQPAKARKAAATGMRRRFFMVSG
jgi:hypothetical protein